MTDHEEWLSLLYEINECSNLTEWEVNFVESVLHQVEDSNHQITTKQGAVIEGIYRRRVR
jgi:hypothetical protein